MSVSNIQLLPLSVLSPGSAQVISQFSAGSSNNVTSTGNLMSLPGNDGSTTSVNLPVRNNYVTASGRSATVFKVRVVGFLGK